MAEVRCEGKIVVMKRSLMRVCLLGVFAIAFLVCARPCMAAQAAQAARVCGSIEDLKLGGYLGARMDACFSNNVIATDSTYLAAVFQKHEGTNDWRSEFWGKWMHSAVPAFRYTADEKLKKSIEDSVQLVLKSQRADGYIGNYRDDAHLQAWDIWGRKYTVLGLLHYYDLTGEKAVLEAASRVIDQLMTEVGPGATGRIQKIGMHHGMASCSVLEPVVWLYKRTQDQKYVQFARHIAAAMEDFEDSPKLISKALGGVAVAERFPHPDPWWSWNNGIKAYEMMSCYQGLLDLYEVTGHKPYLQAAEATARNIMADEINAAGSGAAFECWYHGKRFETAPAYHMMETCVTTTWMRLCQTLLRLTGDPVYGDYLERAAFNAYLATLARDGSTFSKYCPLNGTRGKGEDQCGMTINCCIANGPRGFVSILESMLMADAKSVSVNLYQSSKGSIRMPGSNLRVSIEQVTEYPKDGKITLVVTPDRQAQFAVKLRIPAWSASTSVKMVDGTQIQNAKAGEYLVIERTWKPGDRVELELDMQGRKEIKHEHFAFYRGPVLLARDARFGDGAVDQPANKGEGQKPIQMRSVPSENKDIWLTFAIDLQTGTDFESEEGKPRAVKFCDFSSAGNTWGQDSLYRTWLRMPMNVMARPYMSYDVP